MQKTIYIAGPVNGRDLEDCKAEFAKVETLFKGQDYQVINPVEFILGMNLERAATGQIQLTDDNPGLRRIILTETINKMMREADEVVMMRNWQLSIGATLERDIARSLNIPIQYL